MSHLQVEKRRIYDVFNILEAFKVIFRIDKNKYLWCGLDTIIETLCKLENGEEIRTDEDHIFNGIKTKSNKKKMLTGLSVKLMLLFLHSSKTKDHMTLDEAAR